MHINPEKEQINKAEERNFKILKKIECSRASTGSGHCDIEFTDYNGDTKNTTVIRERKSFRTLDYSYKFIPPEPDVDDEDKKKLIEFARKKINEQKEINEQIKILEEAEERYFNKNKEK